MANGIRASLLLVFVLKIHTCAGVHPWSLDGESPLVITEKGALRGIFSNSSSGKQYAAFMSVPFAEPPLGELRFKAPIEHRGWTGIRDASQDMAICLQNNPYLRINEVSGSEDCLFVNIYVPGEADADTPLPVMVFFHGGGWMTGAGAKAFYGPSRFMDQKIILVMVNYRLGALGLLSTEDEACPGNWAFKDQNMALKWINKHIKNFGGDPNMVTIFGESAGAASCQYHMMSPASRGLFHRAILHSGSSECSWANSSPGRNIAAAKKLGRLMKCPTYSNKKMIECLRTKDARDLIAADINLYDWDFDPMIPFRPVIESPNEDAFLTEDSRMLLKEGRYSHVPIMVGINENEGAIRSAAIFGVPGLLEELSENFDDLAPVTFDYQDSDRIETVTRTIKDFYLRGSSQISTDVIKNLTDIYSDAYFVAGIDETLNLLLPNFKESAYFYHFTFKGKDSFSKLFGDPTRNYGACHVDELIYLFDLDILQKLSEKDEISVSDALTTIWTNFAYSGNPSEPKRETKIGKIPKWPRLDSKNQWKHVEIKTSFTVGDDLFSERRLLWRNLPLWQKRYSRVYGPSPKTEL